MTKILESRREMLRKVRVKNFLSFRDWQTLNLTVAANAPDLSGRFVQSVSGSKDRFPTFVAIFGANASGKTNMLRAIAFLANFMRSSQDAPANVPLPMAQFYGEGEDEEPTEFEVELDGKIGSSEKREVFRYRLVVSHDQERVVEEDLVYFPLGRPKRLFSRRGQEFRFGSDFRIRRNDPTIPKIRENCSVVSTLAQFNHSVSVDISRNLSVLYMNVEDVFSNRETAAVSAADSYFHSAELRKGFLEFSRRFDIGIEKVEIAVTNRGMEPLFFHREVDRPISCAAESHGTNMVYNLFPTLYYAMQRGGVAVIDELDNAIHSLLIPEIVDLFVDPDRNPHQAQLIAVCHNPSILQYLEKEEIYFTEKSTDGATSIYGLKDIRGVRRESNIYANYLAGAFGGVPKIA